MQLSSESFARVDLAVQELDIVPIWITDHGVALFIGPFANDFDAHSHHSSHGCIEVRYAGTQVTEARSCMLYPKGAVVLATSYMDQLDESSSLTELEIRILGVDWIRESEEDHGYFTAGQKDESLSVVQSIAMASTSLIADAHPVSVSLTISMPKTSV